jgi:hypothetical protein
MVLDANELQYERVPTLLSPLAAMRLHSRTATLFPVAGTAFRV